MSTTQIQRVVRSTSRESKIVDFLAATPMDFDYDPVQVQLERLAQIKRALLAERHQERPSTQALPKELPSESPPANPVKPRGASRPRPSTPVAEETLNSESSVGDAQKMTRSWHKASLTTKAVEVSQ
jgi:hypothetical protein